MRRSPGFTFLAEVRTRSHARHPWPRRITVDSLVRKPAPFETPRSPLRQPSLQIATLARIFALAVFVTFAAAWTLTRHYSERPAPMLKPVAPPPVPTYD